MQLFRAIGQEEYFDMQLFGAFRSRMGAMEGKWFAEQFDHAKKWGELLGYSDGFWIVEIEMPDFIGKELFRLVLLDGIGPARFSEIEVLKWVTRISYHKVDKL